MRKSFQAIVVGAGPAGSSAALTMARAGLDVALLERGSFPGEKNMFGGVLHRLPSLEKVFPDFWERAPLERHIVKKGVTFMAGDSCFNTTIEAVNYDEPPYNGYTILRPRFDRWLADEAVKAGAPLITRATALARLRTRRKPRLVGGGPTEQPPVTPSRMKSLMNARCSPSSARTRQLRVSRRASPLASTARRS